MEYLILCFPVLKMLQKAKEKKSKVGTETDSTTDRDLYKYNKSIIFVA